MDKTINNDCVALLSGKFEPKHMFDILRHEESGICMEGSFVAAGSQV